MTPAAPAAVAAAIALEESRDRCRIFLKEWSLRVTIDDEMTADESVLGRFC